MGEYLDKMGFDIVVDLHGNIRSRYLSKHIAAGVRVQYPKRRFQRWAAVKLNKINPDPPHTILNKINPDPPHTIDLYNEAVVKTGGRVYARRPKTLLIWTLARHYRLLP